MNADVPLIVPQVNACSLNVHPPSGIVANPNCSTIQLVRALKPLRAAFDIHQIILTTYQAASGMGLLGCKELLNGAEAVLEGSAGPPAERFPAKAWLLRNASWFKSHGRSSVCLICS
nr:Asd/ArgC dimerization domain-containing protein [Rhizobium laguerreae]